MKNHPLYKKLKQKALDGNYTIEQVEGLDFNQAAKLFKTRSFSNTFLGNMKTELLAEMLQKQDETDLQQLKQTAKSWLDTNFPDWQAERGREANKPYVTIWLKGKPETEQ